MSTWFSCTGFSPSLTGLPRTVPLSSLNHVCSPNPEMHAFRFGLFPFRSPLLWKSMFLSRKKLVSFFSSGYLDVSVHRVPDHTLWIHVWTTEVCSAGFPHSDICGLSLMCSSPQLFAAYHVFLRLLVPRHPPCALIRLTIDSLTTANPSRLAWRYFGCWFVFLFFVFQTLLRSFRMFPSGNS